MPFPCGANPQSRLANHTVLLAILLITAQPTVAANVENPDFSTPSTALPPGDHPGNSDFGASRQKLEFSIVPSNFKLVGNNVTQTSEPFLVPATAQSLRLRYHTGSVGNALNAVRLYVEVLSGANYTIVSRIDEDSLSRSLNEGWGEGVLNIQPFSGKTIKLRFRSYDINSAVARVSDISLNVEVPKWTLSNSRFFEVRDSGPGGAAYLSLKGYSQTATTLPFRVPDKAQTVHFEFMAGHADSGAQRAPLYVEVLSGIGYGVVTRIDEDTLWRSLNDGWSQGVLNLQPFAGKGIKLRFKTWDTDRARARVARITLHTEISGWTLSNSRLSQLSSQDVPTDPGVTQPDNLDFELGRFPLEKGPSNADFESGAQLLDVVITPQALSLDGNQASQTTEAFMVPPLAQSLRFLYTVGDRGNANRSVPLYVQILTEEEGISAVTPIDEGTVRGSLNEGTREATLNLVPFQGKTISLRFLNWDINQAVSWVEGLQVRTEVPDWTLSNGRHAQVYQEDFNGSFLYLNGWSQTATSLPFTVPSETQSLRFTYTVGDAYSALQPVPLFVEVLGGEGFSIATSIDNATLRHSLTDGWQEAVLNLQRFQGRTIKLRFRTWEINGAQVWIDNLSLQVETPGWTSSNSAQARIETADNRTGAYLWLSQANTQAVSVPFKVPALVQYMTFDFVSGSVSEGASNVPLYLEVLSGPGFNTVTRVDRGALSSSLNNGWQNAKIDIKAFQERTIKLRFRTWDSYSALSKIDNIAFAFGKPVDTHGPDSPPMPPYLSLRGANQTVTTSTFTVPLQAPQLSFVFQTGDVGDGFQAIPLYAEVLSGSSFSTVTRIDKGSLGRSLLDGWQSSQLSLAAFAGQTVRVRFRSWDLHDALVHLDEIGVFSTPEQLPVQLTPLSE